MNYNSTTSLTFDEVVKISDGVLSIKNPKFKLLTALFIPSKARKNLYYWYYYSRWIDDFIDDNSNSIVEKRLFLENQFKLVSAILSGNEYKINFTEGYFLERYIHYAKSISKPVLIDTVFIILETIRQDLERLESSRIFSEAELQEYLHKHAETLFYTLNALLLPEYEYKYRDKFLCLNTLVTMILLRDFIRDLEIGYINISREDIAKFNLNIKNLINDAGLKNWFSYKMDLLLTEMFSKEIEILGELPIKLKLFWFLAFPYSYGRILRFKNYDYDPKKMKNKKFFIELKIYFLTFFNGVKLFIKAFF